MESRVEKAIELFKEGYNCAQAVFVTYTDLFGLDKETALKLSSSFGGGMGGMHEVCGTVSAAAILAGLQNGVTKAGDLAAKKANYATVQLLADKFKEENGSIICRQLRFAPEQLPEGKHNKPCVEYVRFSAKLVEEYLLNKP